MRSPATGIIIQARTGSSRHPRKVVLPFHQGNSILDILLARLRKGLGTSPIIIATTCAEGDRPIIELAQKHGVRIFKGSEGNVLERILNAAQSNKLERIIRVCADNPFLNIKFLKMLMDEHNGEDYVSFRFKDHTPVIRSHLGLFAEATTQSALARIHDQTKESIYKEHVTNFIYSPPSSFRSNGFIYLNIWSLVKILDLPRIRQKISIFTKNYILNWVSKNHMISQSENRLT